MATVWKLLAGVPALLLLLIGLAWWAAPEFAGAQLGMTLLSGLGLSSQIADLASFFLTAGTCVLIGIATQIRTWLYPAIMLLAFAICGRIIAWLFHGAALATAMIVVEVTIIALLVLVSRQMPKSQR